VLEVREVSVVFAGLRALDGVTLALEGGEILGLIGPNGSGKTTLVNAITGHVPLAGGTVRVAGETIAGLTPPRIARRGVIRSFQIVRLFEELTVRENVMIGALATGCGRTEARGRAAELLAEFGLESRAGDLGAELSYGDKRRVEIARALAARPRFLLLDEPAAGMNEEESAALLEILAALPDRRGLGLLIIDHDMALILRLCHRLHVLASGRTIAEGDVRSVRNDPAVIAAYLGTEAEADGPRG